MWAARWDRGLDWTADCDANVELRSRTRCVDRWQCAISRPVGKSDRKTCSPCRAASAGWRSGRRGRGQRAVDGRDGMFTARHSRSVELTAMAGRGNRHFRKREGW